VPPRELAKQVADALAPLGQGLCVRVTTAVGGAPYVRQIQTLRRGVEILVATPGRLGDLIEKGAVELRDVAVTVLDEADQMCDLGFLPVVRELLDRTPDGGQRLLFSATLDRDVDGLVRDYLTDPVTHAVDAESVEMAHHLLMIPPRVKFPIIAAMANRPGRTIMFVKTQAGVDELVDQLAGVGVRAGALHGGKAQRVRTRTLAEFRDGTHGVLVATDVAARGIHVDDVSLVVHVDPPKDPKDYLHRAGRTARAGATGTVVTLVMPRQRHWVTSMVSSAGVDSTAVNVPHPGDETLAALTGARVPSGERLAVPAERPTHREGRPSFRDRPASGRGGFRGREDRPARGDRPAYRRDDRPGGHRTDRAGGWRAGAPRGQYTDR